MCTGGDQGRSQGQDTAIGPCPWGRDREREYMLLTACCRWSVQFSYLGQTNYRPSGPINGPNWSGFRFMHGLNN
ncbi:hypothetical protein SORBI_3003G416000 [Sorghum bicolor]|uniref:Uncharacterized protein n=1 Tax=Sorghum bicolor TaxID=4558 RepID=A0A1B6Q836_SORBI|nr:hypothetical protein SORBI_3003G416000 [Sorghum bicolor]